MTLDDTIHTIFLLGGGEHTLARAKEAAALYNAIEGPRQIYCIGTNSGLSSGAEVSEAQALTGYLFGCVEDDDIILQEQGQDIATNLIFAGIRLANERGKQVAPDTIIGSVAAGFHTQLVMNKLYGSDTAFRYIGLNEPANAARDLAVLATLHADMSIHAAVPFLDAKVGNVQSWRQYAEEFHPFTGTGVKRFLSSYGACVAATQNLGIVMKAVQGGTGHHTGGV